MGFSIRRKRGRIRTLLVALKMGAAVALAFFLSRLVHPEGALFSALIALLCVQPTLYGGLRIGLRQTINCLLGAVVGMLFLFLLPVHPLSIGLLVTVVYLLCLRFDWREVFPLAALTALFVVLVHPEQPFWEKAAQRIASVLLGVLGGTVANFAVSLFQYRATFELWITEMGESAINVMKGISEAVRSGNRREFRRTLRAFRQPFGMTARLKEEFDMLEAEARFRQRPGGMERRRVEDLWRMTINLEAICTAAWDIGQVFRRRAEEGHPESEVEEETLEMLGAMTWALEDLLTAFASDSPRAKWEPVYLPGLDALTDASLKEGSPTGDERGEMLDRMALLADLRHIHSRLERLARLIGSGVEPEIPKGALRSPNRPS